MFLSLLNIYVLISLYSLHLFMEFCWFVAVGCFGFKFFCFFFSLQISMSSSSSFVVKAIRFSFSLFFLYAIFIGFLVSWDSSIWFQLWVCFSLIYGVFLIFISHWFEFSFSLFLVMQFLLDFWFLGILLFDFSFRYVLV